MLEKKTNLLPVNTNISYNVEEKSFYLYKQILQDYISFLENNTYTLNDIKFNSKVDIEIIFSKIMVITDSDFNKDLLTVLFYPLLDNNTSIDGFYSFNFSNDDLLREKYLNLLKHNDFLEHIHYYINYINQNVNLSEEKYVLKNFKTKASLKNLNRLQKLVFISYFLESLLDIYIKNSWNLQQKQKMNKLLKVFNVKFKIK
jgi:hypothetical protein